MMKLIEDYMVHLVISSKICGQSEKKDPRYLNSQTIVASNYIVLTPSGLFAWKDNRISTQ